MSAWLGDGVVLEGEGSGVSTPPATRSPRLRGGRGRSLSTSSNNNSSSRISSPKSQGGGGGWRGGGGGSGMVFPGTSSHDASFPGRQQESMDKARELFEQCDKEGKGFITKRDMQRLQGELPLSPEQLEDVFDSLDRDSNGFLTPVEFHAGLGELMGEQGQERHVESAIEESERTVHPEDLKLTHLVSELCADKLFTDQWELSSLWGELRRERPELLGMLREVLSQAATHLHDALTERDNLEQALRRREHDHHCEVRSIYEDMESQIKEEREKRIAQDSMRPVDRSEQLQEELTMREQELEFTLTKQRELESRISSLRATQAATQEHNQRLQDMNVQLMEQLEGSREQLQTALNQMQLLQTSVQQQAEGRERTVLKVSRNMQREKESLTRQLDLLRDMNKRLRDEKDAHQPQKRVSCERSFLPPFPFPQYTCGQAASSWQCSSIHPF
ncbi:EF-hand calcium-binding domain-containing protein 4A isoform X2 [Engraulis encrasicolus]|uniref:EF-hand calcium-binding domain-containing protein 4A isoform X2 n=1 Tax=Engraulis encrasicolus TaxID=184585 RepID=UPI002FD5D8BB